MVEGGREGRGERGSLILAYCTDDGAMSRCTWNHLAVLSRVELSGAPARVVFCLCDRVLRYLLSLPMNINHITYTIRKVFSAKPNFFFLLSRYYNT